MFSVSSVKEMCMLVPHFGKGEPEKKNECLRRLSSCHRSGEVTLFLDKKRLYSKQNMALRTQFQMLILASFSQATK